MPKKQKRSEQKQRRNDPARFDIYAAALYWVVKLIRETWDWFSR